MKKSELLARLNTICNEIEEMEDEVHATWNRLKKARIALEDLPSDPEEIEEDELDIEDEDKES